LFGSDCVIFDHFVETTYPFDFLRKTRVKGVGVGFETGETLGTVGAESTVVGSDASIGKSTFVGGLVQVPVVHALETVGCVGSVLHTTPFT
jgi:hypothetical protein